MNELAEDILAIFERLIDDNWEMYLPELDRDKLLLEIDLLLRDRGRLILALDGESRYA